MKTFKIFMEDMGGGGAVTTGTAGVAGAGDNPQKIVPVSKKAQKRIRAEGAVDSQEFTDNYARISRKLPT